MLPPQPSRHEQHSSIRFLLSRHKSSALVRVEKLKYGAKPRWMGCGSAGMTHVIPLAQNLKSSTK